MTKFLSLPENLHVDGRTFVVGDLHGCYDELMLLLKQVKFDIIRDRLICVGDLVDRGKQNMECVALLNEHWFYSVRGNHEQMCIDGYENPDIAANHKDPRNGGAWFYEKDENVQKTIVHLFKEMPLAIETVVNGTKVGFVHANSLDNWEDVKLFCNVSSRKTEDFLMWDRSRARAGQYHIFEDVRNIDVVFLGHTPSHEPFNVKNCIFIDTAAVFGGYLTLVNLNDGSYHHVE